MNLLHDTSAGAVTTMLDYYGFPPFHGSTLTGSTCFERVRFMEEAFARDINDPRFIPHLQLHEFEALLFSSPESIAAHFPEVPALLTGLQSILGQFRTPEEIDDNPSSSPAHRLRSLVRHYEKVHHGPEILTRIGIQRVRERCAHFAEWLERLEQVA